MAEPARSSADAVVDLYTPYTTTFKNLHGGTNAIRAKIINSIGILNNALYNSQVNMRVNLVGLEEIPYTFTHVPNVQVPLNDLKDNTGYDFKARKEAYGADMIILFERIYEAGGYGGLHQDVCVAGYFGDVPAHEWGHNMGCGHGYNWGAGKSSYAGGYYRSDVKTIMISNYVQNQGATKQIYRFSNPNVTYNDAPIGSATQNNARHIHEQRFRFSNNGKTNIYGLYNSKWVLVNSSSGKAIYAHDNQSGATLWQEWDDSVTNRHWNFHYAWPWSYWIHNAETGRYLTLPANATAGSNVVQEDGAGLNRQRFSVEFLPSGLVQIRGENNWLIGNTWPATWIRNQQNSAWSLSSPVTTMQDTGSRYHQYELRRVID